MTYMQFHLVFILPVIALLTFYNWSQLKIQGRKVSLGLFFICTLAMVYTTPWDNYLVMSGVWSYPPERVMAVIGYVPVEEYMFFVLQSILTGLWLFTVERWCVRRPPNGERKTARWLGSLAFLIFAAVGVGCFFFPAGLYFALILVWAAPIGVVQWAYGGEILWANWRIYSLAVGVPTIYLWFADWSAIGRGIWSISEQYTTGLHLFGLPVEEALFFLVTNVMVVQGLFLFWYEWDQGRFRRALRFAAA